MGTRARQPVGLTLWQRAAESPLGRARATLGGGGWGGGSQGEQNLLQYL
jgi:hypothetical protein